MHQHRPLKERVRETKRRKKNRNLGPEGVEIGGESGGAVDAARTEGERELRRDPVQRIGCPGPGVALDKKNTRQQKPLSSFVGCLLFALRASKFWQQRAAS